MKKRHRLLSIIMAAVLVSSNSLTCLAEEASNIEVQSVETANDTESVTVDESVILDDSVLSDEPVIVDEPVETPTEAPLEAVVEEASEEEATAEESEDKDEEIEEALEDNGDSAEPMVIEPPIPESSSELEINGALDGTQDLRKLNVKSRSMEEIDSYFSSHPAALSDTVTFNQTPSMSKFVAGSLSDTTLSRSLNMLNRIRYVAGLEEVGLTNEYNELAQYASLADACIGTLTHYPAQAKGMPDDVYTKGAKGACQSNLAWCSSLSYTYNMMIVNLWMGDSDTSNISRVGHRRWCLNPTMKNTGFGYVNGYAALYAFDTSNQASSNTYNVVWPAQNMPTGYFNASDAWSISTGKYISTTPTVTLTRRKDNKTWTFSSSKQDGYYNVENSGYGQIGCIIFRPTGISAYSNGDIYDVSVAFDENTVLNYSVNFFTPGKRKIISDSNKQALIEKVGTLNALVSNESVLSDVKLPANWSWKNPDTKLTASNSNPTQNFTAIYSKSDSYPFEAQIPVNITSVSGISISGPTTIYAGEMASYKLTYNTVGYTLDGSTFETKIAWTLPDSIYANNTDCAQINVMPYETDNSITGNISLSLKIAGLDFSSSDYSVTIMPRKIQEDKPDIAEAEIKFPKKSDTYTAVYTTSPITPTMTVRYPYIENEKTKYVTLTLNRDYQVTYSNNINAGTATVTVKGIGEYAGTVNKTYEITQKNIKRVSLSYVGDIKYGQTPSLTVFDGNHELRPDIDYTLVYDKGTADEDTVSTLSVVAKENGNYYGEASTKRKFTILSRNSETRPLANATVEFRYPTKVYTYTGSQIKPSIKVIYDGKTVSSAYYKLSYRNNKNAGTGTIYISGLSKKGKGFYGEAAPITFTINKKSFAKGIKVTGTTNIPINANMKDYTFTVKDGKNILTANSDYVVDYSSIANSSGRLDSSIKTGKKYKIKLVAKDAANFETDTFKEITVTFAKLRLTSKTAKISLTISDPAKSKTTLLYNGTLLRQGVDYKSTVRYNKKTGLYTVTVTALSTGKYTGSKTFKNMTL